MSKVEETGRMNEILNIVEDRADTLKKKVSNFRKSTRNAIEFVFQASKCGSTPDEKILVGYYIGRIIAANEEIHRRNVTIERFVDLLAAEVDYQNSVEGGQ